jgi:hypothetical protein
MNAPYFSETQSGERAEHSAHVPFPAMSVRANSCCLQLSAPSNEAPSSIDFGSDVDDVINGSRWATDLNSRISRNHYNNPNNNNNNNNNNKQQQTTNNNKQPEQQQQQYSATTTRA